MVEFVHDALHGFLLFRRSVTSHIEPSLHARQERALFREEHSQ